MDGPVSSAGDRATVVMACNSFALAGVLSILLRVPIGRMAS
jgi:hypothetical protein